MKQTFFNNIEDEIATVLENSRINIYAMLAWFTNDRLGNLLIKKIQDGIRVKIIISNNEWNLLSKERFNKILDLGGEIRSYGSHSPLDGNFLHRKMCIVDEAIVMNGAFNWTKNASRNKEDYSINNDPLDANTCLKEFNALWDISHKLNWEYIQKYAKNTLKELEELEDKGVSPVDILEDKTATDKNYQSQNLIILNHEKMEVVNQNKELVPSTDSFSNSLTNFTYEKDLVLWGVEPGDYSWYKLKFKVDEKIFNIAIDQAQFFELLKTESDYFNYWLNQKKIPLSLLSRPEGRIRLSAPIHFLKLTSDKDLKKYSKCKYKILTEIDDIVIIKVNRIYKTPLLNSSIGDLIGL